MKPLPIEEFQNGLKRFLMIRGVWAGSKFAPRSVGFEFLPGTSFFGWYCPFDDEFIHMDLWKFIGDCGWSMNDEGPHLYSFSPVDSY